MNNYNCLVIEVIGLSSVVLPVMSIDTLWRVMFCEIERTEFSFIIKHVKILVFSIIMDEGGQNFLLGVCIGTKISIGTLIDRVGIVKTEIFFVFLIAIVFLDKGMSIDTVFSIWTFLFPLDIMTHLCSIKVAITLSIFSVMIIYTVFVVVIFCNVARIYFKVV